MSPLRRSATADSSVAGGITLPVLGPGLGLFGLGFAASPPGTRPKNQSATHTPAPASAPTAPPPNQPTAAERGLGRCGGLSSLADLPGLAWSSAGSSSSLAASGFSSS